MILLGVFLLDLVLQLTVTAIALGVPADMSLVINLPLSVLFIFIGNYMGKLRRNFWGGIHRLGGWLFVLGGLLGLVLSFIPPLRAFAIVGDSCGDICNLCNLRAVFIQGLPAFERRLA